MDPAFQLSTALNAAKRSADLVQGATKKHPQSLHEFKSCILLLALVASSLSPSMFLGCCASRLFAAVGACP